MSAFEKGLCWTLYKHMEADFIHFLEYVPYTINNSKVYSPKLLAMLLQICGYIDTVFKEMAKFQGFQNIPECQQINALESKGYGGYDIRLAQSAFEKIYHLSSNNGAKIIAKLDWFGGKELIPFANFRQKKDISPDWWNAYNAVKHTWSTAMEQANMDNSLEALAGAFLLNVIHYPNIKLLWELGHLKTVGKTLNGLVQERLSKRLFNERLQEAISTLKPFGWNFIVETQLFVYAKM